MRASGVYKIENTVSGKCYVGSAVCMGARWSAHKHELRNGKHHSEKLQRAWRKYGEDAFIFRALLLCDAHNLVMYEQIAIDAIDAVSNGYNVLQVAGNSLGYKHKPESLKLMAAAGIGRRNQYSKGAVMSQETKDKIGAANRGRVVTPEHRAKLCAARVGKTPALGLRHTDEARAKMSATRKGKPVGPRKSRKPTERG